MKKPKVIEKFADNGEHSHYQLVDVESGEVIWSEDPTEANQPEGLFLVDRSALLPDGFKVYKCTDCGATNVMFDNDEIVVGYCYKCEHPIWN